MFAHSIFEIFLRILIFSDTRHVQYLRCDQFLLDTKPSVRQRYRAAQMALWYDLIPKLHQPDGDAELDRDPCRHALHADYDYGDVGSESLVVCDERRRHHTLPSHDRRRQGKSLIECRLTHSPAGFRILFSIANLFRGRFAFYDENAH